MHTDYRARLKHLSRLSQQSSASLLPDGLNNPQCRSVAPGPNYFDLKNLGGA